jgi:uncharacterized protein (TIGR00297 family)
LLQRWCLFRNRINDGDAFVLLNVGIGFILAVIIALAAWRVGSLNRQGALAAALLGTIIFGLGGWSWAVLLLGFFISSSGLSRLFRKKKMAFDEKFSKGSQRDAGQVMANGGIAGLFVLLHVLWPDALWPWLGFAGALASANADTWATELGVLSRSTPRLITNGRKVERGTSGGISWAGTAAAAGGALFIAALGVGSWQGNMFIPAPNPLVWLAGITLAGIAGSLADSLLGATLQAIYWCPNCMKETERHPLHTCGTPTTRLRGWPWLDNDWVNGVCTLVGGIVAVILL